MLWKEDAVRVIRPAGASSAHVVGAEAVTEATLGEGAADVLNEATHPVSSESMKGFDRVLN